MQWETVVTISGAIVILANAAAGLYVLIAKPGRAMRKVQEQIGNFHDDWFGTEARPGVPERPGVMVRLAWIEEQLRPNHGTSLRDAVNRTESGIRRVEDSLAAHLTEHRLAAAQQRVVVNTTAVHADLPRNGEGSADVLKGES
ncbi:hypothetical protein ACQP25_17325 [Microtetraspora malaysiensis]|uniref:hypothetical protein n=1 Tax=Microtetraspora malaysiensis TaxID=161358 RepID=UPI003D8F4CE6